MEVGKWTDMDPVSGKRINEALAGKECLQRERALEAARKTGATHIAAETRKHLRRSSKRNIGISFGYLYPLNGYNQAEKTFALDLRVGHELQDFRLGMLSGVRKGFAMNVYGAYLFPKKDICPYVGGAFGFHWVTHNYHYSSTRPEEDFDTFNEKSGDGSEFTVNGGLRLFRTYNFQIILNLAYVYTLNDFNDQAVLFTIGLL